MKIAPSPSPDVLPSSLIRNGYGLAATGIRAVASQSMSSGKQDRCPKVYGSLTKAFCPIAAGGENPNRLGMRLTDIRAPTANKRSPVLGRET
jgi:hypothetical protein